MIQNAERGAAGDHGGREKMHAGRDPLPAEHHDPQKPRLQHEGHGPFEAEDITEEITDCNGERRPVGAELKLQRDAADHPDTEVQQQQLAPEASVTIVVGVTCLEPQHF